MRNANWKMMNPDSVQPLASLSWFFAETNSLAVSQITFKCNASPQRVVCFSCQFRYQIPLPFISLFSSRLMFKIPNITVLLLESFKAVETIATLRSPGLVRAT